MTTNRMNVSDRFTSQIPEIGDKEIVDEKDEIFEYGFGTPFSYWSEYTYYPFVAAKYGSLKEELLQNKICVVSLNDWRETLVKSETKHKIIHNILGHGNDKNTAFARYNEQLNDIFGIKYQQKISMQHILSILFYTDLTNLPREMKGVCRKLKPEETMKDVKV